MLPKNIVMFRLTFKLVHAKGLLYITARVGSVKVRLAFLFLLSRINFLLSGIRNALATPANTNCSRGGCARFLIEINRPECGVLFSRQLSSSAWWF